MNSARLPRIYQFRATQLGKYFHGYCTEIANDEHRVTFVGRRLPRYSFEPGATEPKIEVKLAGPLSLLKKDFHITATAVVPLPWFQPETQS
jgi:hypothetical protein